MSLALALVAVAAGPQVLVKDIQTEPAWQVPESFPWAFEPFAGTMFFAAEHPGFGRELWTTDGTAAGTQLFLDLVPGAESSNPAFVHEIAPGLMIVHATTPDYGSEYWTTDGTPAVSYTHLTLPTRS